MFLVWPYKLCVSFDILCKVLRTCLLGALYISMTLPGLDIEFINANVSIFCTCTLLNQFLYLYCSGLLTDFNVLKSLMIKYLADWQFTTYPDSNHKLWYFWMVSILYFSFVSVKDNFNSTSQFTWLSGQRHLACKWKVAFSSPHEIILMLSIVFLDKTLYPHCRVSLSWKWLLA